MNRTDRLALWERIRGAHYDPVTRQCTFPKDAPCYVAVHEWAHARQHEENTLAFRACLAFRFIPWLRRFTRLWSEWEADAIARREMRENGIWDDLSAEISGMILRRYALFLLLP